MTSRRRRGFTLIDLFTSLVLMAGFSILTVAAISMATRALRDAIRRQDAAMRYDALIDTLRRDFWACAEPSADDEFTLLFPQGDAVIRWKLDGEGNLERRVFTPTGTPVPNLAARRWTAELTQGIEFELRPPLLTIRVHDLHNDGRPATVTIPSAAQIAGGAR